jgi:hypothetical protein
MVNTWSVFSVVVPKKLKIPSWLPRLLPGRPPNSLFVLTNKAGSRRLLLVPVSADQRSVLIDDQLIKLLSGWI